ncbi:TetR/AcrR family transcriptional regulator [Xylanimonas allomyrinae]|uniref:TetR/AcrR family transcriptional regulator n=1 Tax=Xylanimonas allomyrinae TaxID=2509459 RepID=A0A4P6ERZ4_9MICO|nr:TetR/AcrR family transcriptional regulator [Xylanimonas allomyrinae]
MPAWLGVQRPQRADARRNFDALLAAAREAFAERGARASLEEVARRAGVGIGTLYRNFPTRDALVEAVYVTEIERLVEAGRDAQERGPWESLAAWLARFVDDLGAQRVLLDGLNRDSCDMRACRRAIHVAGEPLLRTAQAAGVARQDVTIDDVVRLVSGVAGVDYPDPAQRARVVGIAIDGLRARPSR